MGAALQANGCICGKRMFQRENMGTCVWCGHGMAKSIVEDAYRRNMEHNVCAIFTTPLPDARVVPLRRRRKPTWSEDECVSAYYAWRANHGREPTSTDWTATQGLGEHRPSYGTIRALFGGWPAFKHYIAEIPRDQVAA